MEGLFETYNEKLQDFYEKVMSCLEEEGSAEEYIFKKIPKIPFVEEHYNSGQLKLILEAIPKTTLTRANNLVKKINDFIERKNDNIYFLGGLINNLYSTLNRKPIK